MPLETEASLKEVVDKAEQIGADLQIKKEALATAITSKKVPTNATDSLQVMKDNVDSIKTKLPILEGDVGVAELKEVPSIYNITSAINQHYYKTSTFLSAEWQVDIPSPTGMKYCEVDNLGNVYTLYVETGSNEKTYIMQYSPEGELKWTREYQTRYQGEIQGIKACKDGLIVYRHDIEFIFIKHDNTIVWQHQLVDLYKEVELYEIFIDHNERIYFVGTESTSSSTGLITVLNSDGTLYKSFRDFSGIFTSCTVNDNGDVFALMPSRNKIVKYSSNYVKISELTIGVYRRISIIDNKLYLQYYSEIQVLDFDLNYITGYKLGLNDAFGGDTLVFDNDNNIYYSSPKFGLTKRDAQMNLVINDINQNGIIGLGKDKIIYTVRDRKLNKFKDNYSIRKQAILKEREVQ